MKTITKTHKSFNELRSICNCVSKEKSKYVFSMNYLFVDETNVIGTNGKTMACMKNVFGIGQGFWQVIKNTKSGIILAEPEEIKEDIGKFSKYQEVLDFDNGEPNIKAGHLTTDLSIDHFRLSQVGICIKIDQLAIFGGLDCDWFVVANDRPLHLFDKSKDYHAVLMPINGVK